MLAPQIESVADLPNGRSLSVRPTPLVGRAAATTQQPQTADEAVPEPVGHPLLARVAPVRRQPIQPVVLTTQVQDFGDAPAGRVLKAVPVPMPGRAGAVILRPQIADEGIEAPPPGSSLVLRPTAPRRIPIAPVTKTPQGADFTPLPDFHPPSVVTRAALRGRSATIVLIPQVDDVPAEQIIAQVFARPPGLQRISAPRVVVLTPQFEPFIPLCDQPRQRADVELDRRWRADQELERRQRIDRELVRRERASKDADKRC
jgi:hypothetical protein